MNYNNIGLQEYRCQVMQIKVEILTVRNFYNKNTDTDTIIIYTYYILLTQLTKIELLKMWIVQIKNVFLY